jgi:hypothetical protein
MRQLLNAGLVVVLGFVTLVTSGCGTLGSRRAQPSETEAGEVVLDDANIHLMSGERTAKRPPTTADTKVRDKEVGSADVAPPLPPAKGKSRGSWGGDNRTISSSYDVKGRSVAFGVLPVRDGANYSEIRELVLQRVRMQRTNWFKTSVPPRSHKMGRFSLRLANDDFLALWWVDLDSGSWAMCCVHGRQHKNWLPLYDNRGNWNYLKNGPQRYRSYIWPQAGIEFYFENPHDVNGWRPNDIIYGFYER